MGHLLSGLFKFILVLMVFTAAYQWWRPLPDNLLPSSTEYSVPDAGVRFFADYTFIDRDGTRKVEQKIWDRAFTLINGANHFMLFNFSHFNDFQSRATETTRALSSELTLKLNEKLLVDRHIAIAFITDPVNTLYGGAFSSQIVMLRKAGVVVVQTNLTVLRDPNLLFSSLWRPLISWWGNSETGGWLPHPFQDGGNKVTLRTWLDLLNLKGNQRNIMVMDQAIGKATPGGIHKMITLVTSANPADRESADGNVALEVDDSIWQDVVETERRVAEASGAAIVSYDSTRVLDETGSVHVQLLTETKIREKILHILDNSTHGDTFDIAMLHLSERDVITAIVGASNRGAIVRIILDPSEATSTNALNGIPNRSVARELISKSVGGITIRWCDTHGEECHANFFAGQTASSSFMMIGSASFTRRDLNGYDLEADIFAQSDKPFTAYKDGIKYFDRMWNNTDGIFTTSYDTFADSSMWRSSVYRMMERTGLSAF